MNTEELLELLRIAISHWRPSSRRKDLDASGNQQMEPREFVDLGSGFGKAVALVALSRKLPTVRGIELVTVRGDGMYCNKRKRHTPRGQTSGVRPSLVVAGFA